MMDVYLRAFEPDDYKLINTWRNTPGLYDLTVGNAVAVSAERDRRWVEEKIFADPNQEIYWAIAEKADDGMIGYLSLNNIDLRNRKAEWGGIIIADPEKRKGGRALQAAVMMLRHAFDELNLHRLTGYWLAEHRSSLFLGFSLGFKKEGVLRDYVFKKDRFHDVIVMSLLKPEFEALRGDLYPEVTENA